MKIVILVPSHIRYAGQCDLLRKCITSLSNQTFSAHKILVSISFEEPYKKEILSLIKDFGSESVKVYPITKQMFQMEHLEKLNNKINEDGIEYDLMMFCDDDDTYHPTRIETFAKYYHIAQTVDYRCSGVYEYGRDKHGVREKEYWCYGLKPNILTVFFERSKPIADRLRHRYGDMVLKWFLQYGQTFKYWIMAPVGETLLYNYNTENTNSITSSNAINIKDEEEMCFYNFVLRCRDPRVYPGLLQKEGARWLLGLKIPPKNESPKILMEIMNAYCRNNPKLIKPENKKYEQCFYLMTCFDKELKVISQLYA